MTIYDDIRASRASGTGAKQLPNNGLHYCGKCGKRFRLKESAEQHILDVHKGDGEAKKEPSRKELMRIALAAEKMEEALKKIAATQYGLQGINEDYGHDANAFNYHAKEYFQMQTFRYQSIARAALAEFRKATE